MADSKNYDPLLEQYGSRIMTLGETPTKSRRDITLGFENTFPRNDKYKSFGFGEYVTPYQLPINGADSNLGFLPSPVAKSTPDPSFGMPQGGAGRNVSTFDQYPAPTYSPNIDSDAFQGFNQSQMKTDGSIASVGSGVGALAGGPVGSGIGAVGGTAVDMYLSYQANEERKKADRQRLEEARRQQEFSNRQAERDRKLAASQYGDKMGFLNAQEDRTQATFEANTKQNRLNMLQNAMTNSLKNSEMVRNIFAKRGVV